MMKKKSHSTRLQANKVGEGACKYYRGQNSYKLAGQWNQISLLVCKLNVQIP